MNTRITRLPAFSVLTVIALVSPTLAHADATADTLLGDKFDVSVGAAMYAGPRYMGSKDYHVVTVPLVSVERGVFFADAARGIGLQYFNESGFYFSQSIYYDPGRKDKNDSFVPGADRLRGMGDVDGSATWHTMVRQQLAGTIALSADFDLTLKHGTNRQNLRVGGEWTAYKQGDNEVTLSLSAYWANREFNQAYFGVTRAQSDRTGFREHAAGAGMYAYSIGAHWESRLAPNWYSTVQVTATPYLRDAKGSPLMQRRFSIEPVLSLRYEF